MVLFWSKDQTAVPFWSWAYGTPCIFKGVVLHYRLPSFHLQDILQSCDLIYMIHRMSKISMLCIWISSSQEERSAIRAHIHAVFKNLIFLLIFELPICKKWFFGLCFLIIKKQKLLSNSRFLIFAKWCNKNVFQRFVSYRPSPNWVFLWTEKSLLNAFASKMHL